MQDNKTVAPHSRKRQRNHEEELDESPAHFRRVRLRYSDQISEPVSSQAGQNTEINPNGSIKTTMNNAASTQAESLGIPGQTTGVIASTSTSRSPAAKDEVFFTYSSAPEEDLRHPIGGSYRPNAQLLYSSDETTAENSDW